MEPVTAGPSQFPDEWKRALLSDDALLEQLVRQEAPGVTIFQIAAFVNAFYRAEQSVDELNATAGSPLFSVTETRPRLEKLLAQLVVSRRQLGWRQREADIALLRWIRHSGMLSLVLGAGVSQGAGAPGWPDLVKALLIRALGRGHEVARMVPDTESGRPVENTAENIIGTQGRRFVREVFHVERFTPQDEAQAGHILGRLEAGEVIDTETLRHAAQLCANLYGQHMFTHVTGILYRNAPLPSRTHRAIASLGGVQEVRGRGLRRGWESVITYNFDDLMGEAFAEYKIPHARYAPTTSGVQGDRDRLAQQSSWHIPIFHLHGYTPRRPFLITDTLFVFSTAQYQAIYGDRKDTLIDVVLENCLANPVHVALYIGCSFTDEVMNQLLREAAHRYPGRWHYAIVRWPGERHGRVPDVDEVEAASRKYLDFGVQPVWVDNWDETPEIVDSLR